MIRLPHLVAKRDARPPGPRTPGWLNALRYVRDPLGLWTSLGRTYGDVAYLKLGRYDCYLVNHPDLIRDVLTSAPGVLVKARAYEEGKRVLGDGLFTSEGEVHTQQRRTVQPLFARARVTGYADVAAQAAERAQERWRPGAVIDVEDEMGRLTMAVIGDALVARDLGEETAEIARSLTASAAVLLRFLLPFSGVLWRLPLPSNRRFEAGRRRLDELIYGLLAERRRAGENGDDLLALLLAASSGERQVRDEVATILLAGHETMAVGLTWTWYLLSRHPAAEAKLHREVDEVLRSRLPGGDDLHRLAFTRMVFQEAMRLYPPAWAIARRTTTEFKLGAYRVPAGSMLFLSQWVTQRDPRFFPDPLVFRPERWADARPALQAYFPFGGGPRVCIGERFAWMEATMILATIARRWRLRLLAGDEAVPRPVVTLRPRQRVAMLVESRVQGRSRPSVRQRSVERERDRTGH